jgi:DNA-binding LacI/PurR family transcriptional regulator
MPTMRDVADHAGVSIATVSFVVNNTKPVTAATRSRIEDSMRVLGYRPNAVARALASRRTRILALAYPMLDHRLGGSGMEFMIAAARTASACGYHLMMWPGANDGRELTELVGQQLVDGVILMEVQLDDPRVSALQATATPYALIGRTADPSDSVHVDIDFEQSTREALQHLHDLGHRHIVFVTGTQDRKSYYNYGPYVRTERAFRQVTARLGVAPVVVESGQDTTAGRSGPPALHRVPGHDRRPGAGRVRRHRSAHRRDPPRRPGARGRLHHVDADLGRYGDLHPAVTDHHALARPRPR